MADIFGLDVASLVNDALQGAGGLHEGVLTKTIAGARDPSNPTAGRAQTTTTYMFSGFVEAREVRLDGALVTQARSVMTIIGASVTPTAVPEVNDHATLGSITYELTQLISRDPASAVYEFVVK